MTLDYLTDHEHDVSPAHLYPADADVLDVYEDEGYLRVDVAVPCPECSQPLALQATVTEVTDADTNLPLDGSIDDCYD